MKISNDVIDELKKIRSALNNMYDELDITLFDKIVTAKTEDRIIEFPAVNEVKVLITKPNKPNEFIVNSIKNTNVHFLNKKTILENCDAIAKLYQ